jgi:hypothetical protein
MRAPTSRARALGLMLAAAIGLTPLASAAKKAAPPPPPRIDKLARLVELEDRRSTGGDELSLRLRDPDRGVRRRARPGGSRPPSSCRRSWIS